METASQGPVKPFARPPRAAMPSSWLRQAIPRSKETKDKDQAIRRDFCRAMLQHQKPKGVEEQEEGDLFRGDKEEKNTSPCYDIKPASHPGHGGQGHYQGGKMGEEMAD